MHIINSDYKVYVVYYQDYDFVNIIAVFDSYDTAKEWIKKEHEDDIDNYKIEKADRIL